VRTPNITLRLFTDEQAVFLNQDMDPETRKLLHQLACGGEVEELSWETLGFIPAPIQEAIQKCKYFWCKQCDHVI
jgi:hypothetical protein